MSESKAGNPLIDELALGYLRDCCGGLSTPEAYVDAFKEIRAAMQQHIENTKPKPDKITIPPDMPTRPSYWRT